MPGTLRPSAGYSGRGVTAMSAVEYMLNHQNSLATRKSGRVRRAVSQTFGPWTRRFDCRQNHTSERSWKYQPLATMPCPSGRRPVSIEAWAVQVTAGKTGARERCQPRAARAASRGPMSDGTSPTTSMTSRRPDIPGG